MTNLKLRLLKLSDLKVTRAQHKPAYVFIEAVDGTIDNRDAGSTFPNAPTSGFTNLMRKIRLNDETN